MSHESTVEGLRYAFGAGIDALSSAELAALVLDTLSLDDEPELFGAGELQFAKVLASRVGGAKNLRAYVDCLIGATALHGMGWVHGSY